MADTDTQRASAAFESTIPALLTFLIADVRGYTRFTNEHGDEAAARLADRFAGFCEEILGAHEGQVIELRGDEALCVFPSARHALRGAVALQETFREATADDPSLPLTVGMGLDAGEAIPIRGGYRGGALNLAARLCSIAGTGEILASETVIGLARKTEGLVFVDRGQVTLKGLAAPVRVLQIAPKGEIPESLPPLQPILVTHPTNLPDDPTPFIGREGEIGAIGRLIRDPHTRLVTLTGPGGTGKTRLALQVGTTLLYDFSDGVFFCDLAPLNDSHLLPSAIADVLGIREEQGRTLLDTLARDLEAKHLLLVLDNFEHLLPAASAVAQLLEHCRRLNVLVTSRTALRLRREREHAVPPLAVPDPGAVGDIETLSQYESVALFIDRARAARDTFAVTAENAPAIAEICYRLDGLPLAIELAAARIKLFPPQTLLQRLSSSLKLLTGGSRDLPERQRTLRSTIDWSYGLLEEGEQTLFSRLSVFAGGWTFEAAEAVCNPEGELDLFDGMASLVDKSLIRQEGEEEPRFGMLETLREYAAEKLAGSGKDGEIRDAHAQYFLGWAEEAGVEMRGTDQFVWLRRGDAELPNIRAAVAHLLARDRTEEALRLTAALFDYWSVRAARPGRELIAEILQRDAGRAAPAIRGRALWALGGLTRISIDSAVAHPILLEALALLRAAGDRFNTGRTHMLLGWTTWRTQDTEGAMAHFQEGLEISRALEDARGIGVALNNIAELETMVGEGEQALTHRQEALTYLHSVGAVGAIARATSMLALQTFHQGNLSEARQLSEEALAAYRRLGDRAGQADVLCDIGSLLAYQGHLNEAELYLDEAATLVREAQVQRLQGVIEACRGMLAAERGDHERSRDLLHVGLTTLHQQQAVRWTIETLERVTALFISRGDIEAAGRLLGAVEVLLGTPLSSMNPPLHLYHERFTGEVRAAMGEDGWERLRAEGAAMSLDEAVAYALETLP